VTRPLNFSLTCHQQPKKKDWCTENIMKYLTTLITVLGILSNIEAFTLTVIVPANDEECFYGEVNNPGATVGFSYAVQSGGSFDIDFKIKAPNGDILYDQPKETQGEFAFAARQVGEYQFCFSNDMSTFSDKVVEFELSVS
jgi:hypothetical protein